MTDFSRLGELTRIRNDFERALMRCPTPNRDVTGERTRLSDSMAQVEAERTEESLRLYRSGVPLEEIREYLAQPELVAPARTGIEVQTGEAEAYFADPEPEAEI